MPRSDYIVLIALCICLQPAAAQEKQVMDLSHSQHAFLDEICTQSIPADYRYINGSVYRDSYGRANGHQYFLSDSWHSGRIYMNHKWYHQILLRYDIHSDELIYNYVDTSGTFALKLNETKIDSFWIEGHTFCNFRRGSSTGRTIDPGFYEVITTGSASLYQKWTKRYNETSQHAPGEFIPLNNIYIQKNQEFYKISRKPGLLRVLKDRGKEIRAYMREHGILMGTGDTEAIKRVIDYYNSMQP